MPVSADLQQAAVPLLATSNIVSQPIHSTELHSPQQMPSNLPVAMSAKEVVKNESSSPPPESISADPDHDTTSNQEYILEPETMMDQGIMICKDNDVSFFNLIISYCQIAPQRFQILNIRQLAIFNSRF